MGYWSIDWKEAFSKRQIPAIFVVVNNCCLQLFINHFTNVACLYLDGAEVICQGIIYFA